MTQDPQHEPAWPWAAACGLPALATLACVVLDRANAMSIAGLAMVYLVATVGAALLLPRGPAVLAAVMAATALNFFFIPPRYSFAIDDPEYWWTLAVVLGLSLALGAMVARLRAGRAQAQEGQARAAQLHALGEALAACEGHDAMARCAVQWLHANLGHACALFVRNGEGDDDVDGDAALRCIGEPAHAAFHPASAQWAVENGRALGRGCPDWPDLPLWCAPLGERASAAHGWRAGGAMQVLLHPRERPVPAMREHWLELARQIGLRVERERAAQAARAAQDHARAEAARNTLLASLSHDLRTPLAGIVGSASALREQGDALSPAQRERLLANLESEARDLTLRADNVLQMARLAQPEAGVRMEWESIEDVLAAAVARMRRRWSAARIQLRVTAGLPPVRAEAELLAQAIANLVDNAVRHSGDAPDIVVSAGRSRDGVFIAVRDHGEGLPEGDPSQLFARYRQGAQRAGGAGLGLAICELIVRAHGGRIEAHRCEPGAEFRIDLPVGEAPPGAPPDVAPRQTSESPPAPRRAP